MSWLKRLFCRHRNTRLHYLDDVLTHMPHEHVYTMCRDCDRVTHVVPIHEVTARVWAASWLDA